MKRKNYTFCGQTKTANEWAKHCGITFNGFKMRLDNFRKGKITEEDVIRPMVDRTRPVTHGGETHSYSEWADILGITKDTFGGRYRKYEKGLIDEDELFHKGNISEKLIEYNGVSKSLTDWARYFHITRMAMEVRMRKVEAGLLSMDDAFNPSLSSYDLNRTMIQIAHDGKTQNISDWARELGVHRETMKYRINMFKAGKMTEEKCFAHGNISTRREVSIKGKKFTANGLAERLGISLIAAYGRLARFSKGKIDADQLMTKGNVEPTKRVFKCYRTIPCNGQMMSVGEIAKLLRVGYETVSYRIKRGDSIEEIISNPRISDSERSKKSSDTRKRNARIRELKRMGIAV